MVDISVANSSQANSHKTEQQTNGVALFPDPVAFLRINQQLKLKD